MMPITASIQEGFPYDKQTPIRVSGFRGGELVLYPTIGRAGHYSSTSKHGRLLDLMRHRKDSSRASQRLSLGRASARVTMNPLSD